MVIPRTFISKHVIPTPKGWQVTVWLRPRESIFSKPHYRFFPTEEEARDYLRDTWKQGNLQADGSKAKYTTKSVVWISDDMIPTRAFSGLPTVTTAVEDGRVKVWVDGLQIAEANTTRPFVRGLKQQIASHPLGECLIAMPCGICRRLPRINLLEGTFTHNHSNCFNKFQSMPDPLIPLPLQIAAWNKIISLRPKSGRALPLHRPDYWVLGVLRHPNLDDHHKKICKIESFVFDK